VRSLGARWHETVWFGGTLFRQTTRRPLVLMILFIVAMCIPENGNAMFYIRKSHGTPLLSGTAGAEPCHGTKLTLCLSSALTWDCSERRIYPDLIRSA
jgi:hypothetical protein